MDKWLKYSGTAEKSGDNGENKQQPTESGETGLLDAKKEEADADNQSKD